MLNFLLRLTALVFFGFAFFWAWHDQYDHAAYAIGLACFNQILAQEASNA